MRDAQLEPQLRQGPFTIEDARRAGLERWHLEGAIWRRVGPRVYTWARTERSALFELEAAALRLPSGAVFSGYTAAWLHGLDVSPGPPIEVTAPKRLGISARAGMALRRCELLTREIVRLRSFWATTMPRTLCDLAERISVTEAVVLVDAALHFGVCTIDDLVAQARRSRGRRGVLNFRRAIELAEPAAESPMESRLRMELVIRGLPRPEAQLWIYDPNGNLIGRPDLFYREAALALEYDGGGHDDSTMEDDRRQNRFVSAGIMVLRYTKVDMARPEGIAAQVGQMLRARRVHAPAAFIALPGPREHALGGG